MFFAKKLTVGSLSCLLLAACNDGQVTQPSGQVGNKVMAELPSATTLDDAFLRIANRVESFGGAYYAADGVLVLRGLAEADSTMLRVAVETELQSRVRVNGEVVNLDKTDLSIAPKGFRFERALVPFRSLYELRARIADAV